MKNSNTCKAFPALRAIGSNRYSPNCRNPWYIQYKPDLDEKKSVFITAQLEVQGKNMIWFTDCNLFWNIFCHLLAALQAANLAVALAPLTKIIQNKKWQKVLFDKFYDQ